MRVKFWQVWRTVLSEVDFSFFLDFLVVLGFSRGFLKCSGLFCFFFLVLCCMRPGYCSLPCSVEGGFSTSPAFADLQCCVYPSQKVPLNAALQVKPVRGRDSL